MALRSDFAIDSLYTTDHGTTLRFLTMPGESYAVEYSDELGTHAWTLLSNGQVLGDGNMAMVIDAPAPSAGNRLTLLPAEICTVSGPR